MKKAIIYLVVFAAIQLIVPQLILRTYSLIAGSEPEMNATMMIISLTASSIAGIALFLYLKWAEISPSYIRSRPWAVLFWCAIAAFGAIIPSSFLQEVMPELPNIVEDEFDMILRNRWGYFAVGLLAPISEELVFRGAILRALLRWTSRHWVAIAIGLLLGWLYYRTDSIVPGIVYHWVNNSVAYVIYNLYPDPSLKLIDLFGSQRTVAAAVLFSLFILLPALYQLYLRLKKA